METPTETLVAKAPLDCRSIKTKNTRQYHENRETIIHKTFVMVSFYEMFSVTDDSIRWTTFTLENYVNSI